MKLTFTYKFEDYLAINEARDKGRKFAQTRKAILFIAYGLISAVSVFWIYQIVVQGRNVDGWMFPYWAFLVLVPLIAFIIRPRVLRRHYNQLLIDGKPIGVLFTDEGVETDFDGVRTQTAWRRIIKAVEGPEHFLLWVNNANAYSIPKRAFTDTDQMQHLRELIQQNVS
ncbi:MAG: YcxB family protein [Stappiaceae bacterium]